MTPKSLFAGSTEGRSQMKIGESISSSNDFQSFNSIFQTGGMGTQGGMSFFGKSMMGSGMNPSMRSMQSQIMHRKNF
jgi:hypothetical protein